MTLRVATLAAVTLAAVAASALAASGQLDTSFAGDGKRTTTFSPSTDQGHDVALQPNGRIVVDGTAGPMVNPAIGIARYGTDGGLDHSFSGDGKRLAAFGPNADQAYDVAIQDRGRIVVAGTSDQGATGLDFALARFKANGSLDASFAGDGKRLTTFNSGDIGNGVAIQRNGRIIVAGSTADDFALARYLGV
jgi:uncharacterized delta-60 repeat protein